MLHQRGNKLVLLKFIDFTAMFTLFTINCIRCLGVLWNDQISVDKVSRMRTAKAELACMGAALSLLLLLKTNEIYLCRDIPAARVIFTRGKIVAMRRVLLLLLTFYSYLSTQRSNIANYMSTRKCSL